MSEELKKKLSQIHLERPNRYWLGKKRPDISILMKTLKTGTKLSEQQKIKIGDSVRGNKNGRWIINRTLIKQDKERGGPLHKQWSNSVKRRDGWKCKIMNNNCEGRVVAHHILSWREYLDLRYDINNGITLCHFHHPRKRVEERNLSPYFSELVTNIK